ncbi:MAG: Gfo/Idh/MocA family oxidoreductase [Clostridia bacterium]|nr:Gfo/Idh/MocA family oxidoreductase [Clostridia bacterium]
MKFAVIGLGSMGKRRIRNLLANNQKDIIGIDLRQDRCKEAEEKYGVRTYQTIDKVEDINNITAFIISVPPDKHMEYAGRAYEAGIHSFIEASVVDEGMKELIEKSKSNKAIRICPSCTLRFHPSICLIKDMVTSGKIGKISNFTYHSGQYLPDWHPWEDIKDFYVSKKETGGCREIVPFELAWLNWIFGDISSICGFNEKTVNLGIDIDDVYASCIKYKNGLTGTLLVDVVSRYAVRRLILNGLDGQIQWDWNKKSVEVYLAASGQWEYYHEPEGSVENGYNANIIEEMYINEIGSFIDAITGKSEFPNTLEEDYKLLQYLYGIEQANEAGRVQTY